MGKKPRAKMSIENRAKQFSPFAAIRGLQDALEKKERIIVEKIELSEEMAEELDRKMQQLEKGRIATVVYFAGDNYLKKTGIVARIDKSSQVLQIVDTKINFKDILDVE
ncbi:MAG: YolD-like family protein [Lachnospiraceae bacterium]|nr:YolD-like family protein [Lachnospiraceae bacterium]